MRVLLPLSILWWAASGAFAEDPLVVLAASRDGRIDVFDQKLSPLGSIGVNALLEGITASPDGRTLYIAQENSVRHTCCGLYALDLETHQMCLRIPGAMFGVPSPDGHWLLTQIDHELVAYPAERQAGDSYGRRMKASGKYNLQPSPDGRWVFGITNSPGPSLDVFDLNSREPVRKLAVPTGPVTGVWAGQSFYLFAYTASRQGQLWEVKPEDTELPSPKKIILPDFHGACNEPLPLMLTGAKDRLYLAEAFGHQVDRRGQCPNATPGGIYMIQPSSGQVFPLDGTVHVNRMAATPDGRHLFVIDSTSQAHGSDVRLVHFDRDNRGHASHVELSPGDWDLSLAHIPAAIISRGYSRAYVSCSR